MDTSKEQEQEESSVPSWFYGLLLLFLTFIGLAIYLFFIKDRIEKQVKKVKDGTVKQPQSSSNYDPVLVWGDISPALGAKCTGYKFPHSTYKEKNEDCEFGSGNGANTYLFSEGRSLYKPLLDRAVPATSLNTPLDSVIFFDNPFFCNQTDTANIILVERTCNKILKTAPNNISLDNFLEDLYCIGNDGNKYYYGETEQYYSYCDSKGKSSNVSSPFCPGIVGGLSVGFQYLPSNLNTINDYLKIDVSYVPLFQTNENKIVNLTIGTTDINIDGGRANNLASLTQEFQIIRTEILTDRPKESNQEGKNGVSGVFAKIIHRETGLCLKPNTTIASRTSNLIIGECDVNDGYVWALIPELIYTQRDSTGKVYYDVSCKDNKIVYDDDGNPVVKAFKMSGPQQIVYIGSAIDPNTNINLSKPDETSSYLQDPRNNAYSLYMNKNSTGNAISFGPFQTLKTFINTGQPTAACSLTDIPCLTLQCTKDKKARPATTNRTNYNSQISSMNLFNSVMASCKTKIMPF